MESKRKAVCPPRVGRLIELSQWGKYHLAQDFSLLILHEKTNGFDKVVKRSGGKVYIDEEAFFRWIDEQQATPE